MPRQKKDLKKVAKRYFILFSYSRTMQKINNNNNNNNNNKKTKRIKTFY